MPNLLQQCAEMLQQKMEESGSEMVEYCRPGGAAFPVRAVIGRTISQNDAGSGFIVRVTMRDFIIRQSELKGLIPKRNDEIRQKIGDITAVFTLNSDSTESHYEETDGYGVAWRIHTKRDKINA